MEILTKSAVELLLVMVAASTALLAQSSESSLDKPQTLVDALDARRIVDLPIAGHRAQLAGVRPLH
jgi:hypothetical protein